MKKLELVQEYRTVDTVYVHFISTRRLLFKRFVNSGSTQPLLQTSDCLLVVVEMALSNISSVEPCVDCSIHIMLDCD